MQLSKETLDIMKLMSMLNQSIIIKEGSVLRTMNEDANVVLEYHSEDVFEQEVRIFNMQEFLSIVNVFDKPELELFDNYCFIKQGRQKVKFIYADAALLNKPTRGVKLPSEDVVMNLSSEQITRIVKMSAILSANVVSFVSKGGKVKIIVEDKAAIDERREPNSYEIELEDEVGVDFTADFTIEKLRLALGHSYTVTFSNKLISKWKADDMEFSAFITMELSSSFK